MPRTAEELRELITLRFRAALQTLEADHVEIVMVARDQTPDGYHAIIGTTYSLLEVQAMLLVALKELGTKLTVDQLRQIGILNETAGQC